jgi:hypothetical protein
MLLQEYLRSGGTPEQLKEKYAVDFKSHGQYPNLILFKYDQIDSPFSEEIVRECRGVILDSTNNWNVVNYGMNKFFNYGEGHAATIDWKTARVQTKEDGSLIQLYFYDNHWMMATSGSPDGSGSVGDFGFTFSELFWKTFFDYGIKLPLTAHNRCFFFELTSPFNKIVVRHKEPKLTLLGGRNLFTMQELTLEEAHEYFPYIPVVKEFPLGSIEDVINSFDTFTGVEQEGYVVVDASFNRIKVKHSQYIALHHMKDSLGSKRALIGVVQAGEISEVISALPEYTEILTEAKERLDALVKELEEIYDATKQIETQKEFALTIIGKKCRCTGALFALRAKKTTSIRSYLSTMHIDSLVDLLGYQTEKGEVK